MPSASSRRRPRPPVDRPTPNVEAELRRLTELMPASGRMWTQIEDCPLQREVITSPFPLPWMRDRPVRINFALWREVPRPQRDLLLLRQTCWTVGVRWFEPSGYQAAAAAGVVAAGFEFAQADAVGVLVAGGLATLAGMQIWRRNLRTEREVEADRAALRVAERRGYPEPEAARHLLAALETVATLEGRSGLSFVELLRSQNLQAIAGLSPVGMPDSALDS